MRRIISVTTPVVLLLVAGLWRPEHAFAQVVKLTPGKGAMLVLDSARRAYNDGRYDVAAERFRKFVQDYGGHEQAPSAYYGLGVSLLEGPKRDCARAAEALRVVLARPDFADRPFAVYYMGVASRGQGVASLAKVAADPGQASSYRSYAASYFTEAARHFAAAVDAFAARTQATTAPGKSARPDGALWANRARCDWCDMLLRTGKPKQAAGLAESFLNDKANASSAFRPRMLYYLGYARFAAGKHHQAGRILSQLAPFDQEFGVHTRYLLARAHHLAREYPEAAALYKAVIAVYERSKADAVKAIRSPGKLTPSLRRRAENLANRPAPDYVARAAFYGALVAAESAKFSDAMAGFGAFIEAYGKHPLAAESRLRQGYCQLQLRSYSAAIKTLDPLRSDKRLGIRATWWLARARVAGANPADARTYAQTLKTAMSELNRAAEMAREQARRDTRAGVVRADILIELADTQQLAGLYKEAAATYSRALSETYSRHRAEEVLQRLATAQHLNGDYSNSDRTCETFEQKYPQSTLLAAVWFRKAENACLSAMAAISGKHPPSPQDAERRFESAITRYKRLLGTFPDFAQADLARYGLATAQYQLKRYREALATLSGIPEGNCAGELAPVSYLMADCLLRTLPAKTDRAVPAARLIGQATRAAKLLSIFVAAEPKSPQAPDALLKLGHCHQRIGAVLAAPADKAKAFTQAQQAYDRLLERYGKDPLVAAAVFERAKCKVLLGDTQTAVSDLMRFRRDPFRSTDVAPLALVRLSALLRALKRSREAVEFLAEYRNWHKSARGGDAHGRKLGPQFLYEQALALRDNGKPAEAIGNLEAVIRYFPKRPEAANAFWRTGQCRREELAAALAEARKVAAPSGPARDKARQAVDQCLKRLLEAADSFAARTKALAKSMPSSEAHLRMAYETAWCYRMVGDSEVASARRELQKQAVRRVLAQWPRQRQGQRPRTLSGPRLARRDIPLQDAEKLALKHYGNLIAAAPESPLAGRTRFELAELLAQRGKDGEAIELLETALESNPPTALAQQVRLRLAASLISEGRPKAALEQIRRVAGKTAGSLSGEVRYLTGEAYMKQENWPKAIEQLVPFVQTPPYHTMSNVADRALLRLGRAYAHSGKWPQSRQAMERLLSHFPRSPLIYEARLGVGRAYQNEKNTNYAMSSYRQVTGAVAGEVAARAQLGIGECLLTEKKLPEAITEFLVVPYTYDYPACSAEARFKAGQAHLDLKQPDEAAKLFSRVVKDHPSSEWAKRAAEKLAALKPKPTAKK